MGRKLWEQEGRTNEQGDTGGTPDTGSGCEIQSRAEPDSDSKVHAGSGQEKSGRRAAVSRLYTVCGVRKAEKYLKKGTKIVVEGRIQTGSYTNREGQKVYTTEVMVESQEFAESKREGGSSPQPEYDENGFMNIPDGINEELPFS